MIKKSGITPQKSTVSGLGLILYQLMTLLETVPVGGFIASLQGMTYGVLIAQYSPIILGILLICFDGGSLVEMLGGKDANKV